MVADYKSYRVRVQLECGHVEVYKVEFPERVPPEYVQCGQCKCPVAVWAIECREWRSKCTQCRFTRWSGQSETVARNVQRKHFVSTAHQSSVVYTGNPTLFERIKKYRDYGGRSFRYRIANPDVPPVKFPRKIVTVPDEPPF